MNVLKKFLILLILLPVLTLPFKSNKLPPPFKNGIVTSAFASRTNPVTQKWEFHNATDIAAPLGTPILSSDNCEVIEVSEDNVYGIFVTLKNKTLTFRYCHLSKTNLKQGWKIKRGDMIGYVGNTGYATGAHLHIEIIKDGKYINPETVMNFK